MISQVDPVEGGNANDYDYAEGDPVNQFDLSGRHCQKTKTVTDEKTGKKKTVSHNGHWKSWGCRGPAPRRRPAEPAGEPVDGLSIGLTN